MLVLEGEEEEEVIWVRGALRLLPSLMVSVWLCVAVAVAVAVISLLTFLKSKVTILLLHHHHNHNHRQHTGAQAGAARTLNSVGFKGSTTMTQGLPPQSLFHSSNYT